MMKRAERAINRERFTVYGLRERAGNDPSVIICVCPPFTVHRSPFTVHRSPFTVHRAPCTAYCVYHFPGTGAWLLASTDGVPVISRAPRS